MHCRQIYFIVIFYVINVNVNQSIVVDCDSKKKISSDIHLRQFLIPKFILVWFWARTKYIVSMFQISIYINLYLYMSKISLTILILQVKTKSLNKINMLTFEYLNFILNNIKKNTDKVTTDKWVFYKLLQNTAKYKQSNFKSLMLANLFCFNFLTIQWLLLSIFNKKHCRYRNR